MAVYERLTKLPVDAKKEAPSRHVYQLKMSERQTVFAARGYRTFVPSIARANFSNSSTCSAGPAAIGAFTH